MCKTNDNSKSNKVLNIYTKASKNIEQFVVLSLLKIKVGGSSWIKKIKINGKEVKVKIDPGAENDIVNQKV